MNTIARDPRHTDLLRAARQDATNGCWDTAWQKAAAALEQDETRAEALNLLGIILDLQSRSAEATQYYRAAIAIDPSYRPAHQNLDRHNAGLGHASYRLAGLGPEPPAPIREGGIPRQAR